MRLVRFDPGAWTIGQRVSGQVERDRFPFVQIHAMQLLPGFSGVEECVARTPGSWRCRLVASAIDDDRTLLTGVGPVRPGPDAQADNSNGAGGVPDPSSNRTGSTE